MPRRRVAERRAVLPDPVYNSALVTKFINGIMWGGKRSIAERTFYDALAQVGEKASDEPLIRWIVAYARGRGEKTMTDRLAGELLDAANNRGNAVKKKEDTHRMADANKAFAHYKW